MSKSLAKKGTSAMRRCAFCKFFNDPTYSVISPKKGCKDMWEYDTQIKKTCIARNNVEMLSQHTCLKFVSKI